MSKRNGDRARAQREQKKKLLRRQRGLELRQSLAPKAPEAAPAAEAESAIAADRLAIHEEQ